MNGRTYVKFPKRTNWILNNQNFDTYCFLWSILACIQPVDNIPHRVSKDVPYQNELNINYIDFAVGKKVIEIPRFERLNPTISINVFKYSADEDIDYKLVPLYNSKHNESRRFIDLVLYKNHYILSKNFMYLSVKKIDRRYVCRNCLNSYTNQLELTSHKRLWGINDKSVYIPCKELH